MSFTKKRMYDSLISRSGLERLQDSSRAQCESFYHNAIAQDCGKKIANEVEDIEVASKKALSFYKFGLTLRIDNLQISIQS